VEEEEEGGEDEDMEMEMAGGDCPLPPPACLERNGSGTSSRSDMSAAFV
jgi:hypothetical protein